MTTTIGSVDLNALSDLYNDANQYFWFESNPDATYGAGVHITLSPDTSFIANPSGQNVLINTDGISFRNGLLPMMTLDNDSLDFNVINATTGTYNNVASFGSTTTVIGEEANANLHLTFNNLSMVDANGTEFFKVGDNRNADGIATVKHTAMVSVNSAGSATVTVNSNISSIVSVYADSAQLSSSSYSFSQKDVTINGLTANSKKTIEITYTTTESTVYLTFGERDSSGNIGNYSVAEGYMTKASGYSSHAEGYNTTASGHSSHAEGYMTTASGDSSHAEGDRTTASGYSSNAEGYGTRASGSYSHAGGHATVADGGYMTAIGRYNTKNSGKAFVIGNGAHDRDRSDAFAVDWSGNTVMKGELTLGTALSIANGGTGATTAAAARTNLGITAANLGIKDYVVEQGTSGDWKYRKWNSGIAECFGYISLGSISVSAVGNVYRGTATVVLPGIFNDIPSNVHITNGNPLSSVISINGRASDASTLPVYVWKSTKGAVDVSASFYIIGTWK